jgi:hypothetical protein
MFGVRIREFLLSSDFIATTPAIKEMDLNPVFAYKEGAIAVDARIIVDV